MKDIEKRILEKLDNLKDEIIEFHQKLVQIPSVNPPGTYKKISAFVESKMKEIGLKTKNLKSNVIGEIGSADRPSLIIYGHLDTVEPFSGWTKDPFKGEIIENKIYGRGASDNKASVTAAIFAAKALLEAGVELNGKLTVIAVIDEELGGIQGAKYLVDKGIAKGDACILGDGPADYPIGYCAGAMFVLFLINGKQTHLSLPDLPAPNRNQYSGINAIQKMLKIMNFLTDLQEEFNQTPTQYPVLPDAPSKVSQINIAVINGGTKISIVPNKCLLQCSINTIPEHDIESIKTRILGYVETLKNQDPDMDITVQIPVVYTKQMIDPNSHFATIFKSSLKTVFHEERDLKFYISATDAHYFQEKGIETILYGAHRAANQIHAADEFVFIADLLNATKVFAITALNYLHRKNGT